MSYYERAADEFENHRDQDLWYECLAECDMDEKKATAMYLREAAENIRLHDMAQAEETRRIREEVAAENARKDQQQREKAAAWRARMKAQAASDHQLPFLKPVVGVLLALLLSWFTFGGPLVAGGDGFMAALWRWPVAGIHLLTSAMAFYAIFVWLRRRAVRDYLGAGVPKDILLVYGIGSIVISGLLWFLVL